MKYLDLTLSTPAEDLALDEALLDACEASESATGVLRFYQTVVPCVVLGYGNRREAEVNLAACAAEGVPVLRRISGGGTVVLGRGCLAYALVLPIAAAPDLASVTGTNRWVMERHRRWLAEETGLPIEVRGHTDLTVGDRKFGGNAQRRRRRMLLFHGTFLLDFDLGRIARLLRLPPVRPTYRGDRDHGSFVANLGWAASAVKEVLRRGWGAETPWTEPLEARVGGLMAERYGRTDWHDRR